MSYGNRPMAYKSRSLLSINSQAIVIASDCLRSEYELSGGVRKCGNEFQIGQSPMSPNGPSSKPFTRPPPHTLLQTAHFRFGFATYFDLGEFSVGSHLLAEPKHAGFSPTARSVMRPQSGLQKDVLNLYKRYAPHLFVNVPFLCDSI